MIWEHREQNIKNYTGSTASAAYGSLNANETTHIELIRFSTISGQNGKDNDDENSNDSMLCWAAITNKTFIFLIPIIYY